MAESPAPGPLAGIRIIEISSFVAVPLAGMTLTQLGAEVIRVDPVGGAADYRRWPVTDDGTSIYWAGLNKGKRSVAVDMRSPAGQDLVTRLIVEGGAGGGILITNVVGRQWHSYDTLAALRPDLIHLEVSGRADGGTGVDYTVNAGVGFPLVTGSPEQAGPVNHVLPAWDVSCGLYAVLGVLAALRRRDDTGAGSRLRIPLEDVALATAGNLGFLTEPMINGTQRERLGNALYGQYGETFTSGDGVSFMLVALTGRHFRDLAELTGTTKVVAALAEAFDADFTDEGQRYRHRAVLGGLFSAWFAEHSGDEIAAALSKTSILWERYRTFTEVSSDPKVTANPLFTRLNQPRVGEYLAPGLPVMVDGGHSAAVPAPALGDDTAAVLGERLGVGAEELARLCGEGTVATAEG
ncbi:CoA transferase [Mycolicibacterium palauense]|uniref:CoA transferase n=1 Tax=Mycolicibacterium palauense TaxID=2034511 RepID=UPI000BFED7BE|nr:CoA transferase [Mycolicibacterium palauense]